MTNEADHQKAGGYPQKPNGPKGARIAIPFLQDEKNGRLGALVAAAGACYAASMSGARLDWAILLILVVIWGSAFAGLKIAALEVSPAWVAAGRLIVATIVLAALAQATGERFPPLSQTRTWRVYALIGAFGTAAPFFLFAWAAGRMDSTIVAICNGGSPFFTAVFAAFMLGDRMGARSIVGLALGFAGLLVLASPGLTQGATAQALGVAAGLVGAAGYAYANVVTKTAPPVGPIVAAAMFCLAGAVVSTPIAALTSPLPVDVSMAAWTSVIGLGLFPTGIASVLYVMLIRRRGPLFTAYTTYLTPLWAVLVGVVLLQERPGPETALALALVLAGMAVSNWPTGQPLRSPTR